MCSRKTECFYMQSWVPRVYMLVNGLFYVSPSSLSARDSALALPSARLTVVTDTVTVTSVRVRGDRFPRVRLK